MGNGMIPADLDVTGAKRLRDGAAAAPTFDAIHDLGNLIQVVSSGMNILARDPNVIAAPAVLEVVGGARAALERAGALIRNTMARGDERQRRNDDPPQRGALALVNDFSIDHVGIR